MEFFIFIRWAYAPFKEKERNSATVLLAGNEKPIPLQKDFLDSLETMVAFLIILLNYLAHLRIIFCYFCAYLDLLEPQHLENQYKTIIELNHTPLMEKICIKMSLESKL